MQYKCTKCELHKTSCAGIRNEHLLNCIDGVGSKNAKVMLLGLNPGAVECESQIPFSGKEGKKLKECLEIAGISENDVYMTYVVKCRTPNTKKSGNKIVDRNPLKKEIVACKEHLDKEIEEIKPNVIVLLGNDVSNIIIGKKGVTSIHGTPYWHEEYQATCIPVYKPSYLLRQFAEPKEEQAFIDDLRFAIESSKDAQFKEKEKLETRYVFADTIEKVRGLIKRLKQLDEYVIDIETTGLDPRTSELLGIAFSWKQGTGVYVPFNKWFCSFDPDCEVELRKYDERAIWEYVPEGKKSKKKETVGTLLYDLEEFWSSKEYAEMMKDLVPAIVDEKYRKIGHNLAFDVSYLNGKWNVDIKNADYCTMLAEYLPDPEKMGGRSLEELAWLYTDMGGYDDGLKSERSNGFKNTHINDLFRYGCGDVDATYRIYKKQEETIKPFLHLLTTILVPLSIAIREMEYTGVKVDIDRITKLSKDYEEKIQKHEQKLLNLKDVKEYVKIYEESQYKDIKRKWLNSEALKKRYRIDEYFKKNLKPFNYASTIQLRALLSHIDLDTGSTTDTGLMSTNEKSLN
jgi:uracil-DNA glycosylase family 4